jgi:ribosome maturation factor RimP
LRSFLKKILEGTDSPLFVYIIFLMDLVEEIRDLATLNLSSDKFVVEVLISGKKIPKRVLIIIDGDHGITIDDCAGLSRKLSKELDQRAFFGEENYMLEVSTPGLDHPLKLKRQYYKNIGRGLKVKFQDTITEGKLTQVTEDKIILAQELGAGKKKEIKNMEIPFSEIEKAFVLVSFK